MRPPQTLKSQWSPKGAREIIWLQDDRVAVVVLTSEPNAEPGVMGSAWGRTGETLQLHTHGNRLDSKNEGRAT